MLTRKDKKGICNHHCTQRAGLKVWSEQLITQREKERCNMHQFITVRQKKQRDAIWPKVICEHSMTTIDACFVGFVCNISWADIMHELIL